MRLVWEKAAVYELVWAFTKSQTSNTRERIGDVTRFTARRSGRRQWKVSKIFPISLFKGGSHIHIYTHAQAFLLSSVVAVNLHVAFVLVSLAPRSKMTTAQLVALCTHSTATWCRSQTRRTVVCKRLAAKFSDIFTTTE